MPPRLWDVGAGCSHPFSGDGAVSGRAVQGQATLYSFEGLKCRNLTPHKEGGVRAAWAERGRLLERSGDRQAHVC
jgi:hypothetical protein